MHTWPGSPRPQGHTPLGRRHARQTLGSAMLKCKQTREARRDLLAAQAGHRNGTGTLFWPPHCSASALSLCQRVPCTCSATTLHIPPLSLLLPGLLFTGGHGPNAEHPESHRFFPADDKEFKRRDRCQRKVRTEHGKRCPRMQDIGPCPGEWSKKRQESCRGGFSADHKEEKA